MILTNANLSWFAKNNISFVRHVSISNFSVVNRITAPSAGLLLPKRNLENFGISIRYMNSMRALENQLLNFIAGAMRLRRRKVAKR